jgi:hypothetical protein
VVARYVPYYNWPDPQYSIPDPKAERYLLISNAMNQPIRSFVTQVHISVQVGAALLLVTSGIAIIILWLMCAILSLGASSALAPWTAAGVLTFGPLFILLAAVTGVDANAELTHMLTQE